MFVDDFSRSLDGHVNNYEEMIGEVVGLFHQFEEEWNNKLDDLKVNGEDSKKPRASLREQLHEFSRTM